MTMKDVIRILILSPIYFRLDAPQRLALVQEFLEINASLERKSICL